MLVKHKAGNSNVVPDALSRLKVTPTPADVTGVRSEINRASE